MKTLILVIFCLSMPCVNFAQEISAIVYPEEQIPALFDSSKSSHKKVFLIYLDSRNREEGESIKNMLKDSILAQVLKESFLNAMIFVDKKKPHAFIKKHHIEVVPAFLVFNSEKQLLKKIVGLPNSSQMAEILKKVIASESEFVSMDSLNARYLRGESDLKFLTEYIKRKSYEEGPQAKVLDHYLKQISPSDYKTEKILGLISTNIVSVNSEAFMILANALRDFDNLNDKQKELIILGIGNAKTLSFKEAVLKKNRDLLEDIIQKTHQTAYSKQGADLEELQFRYDFAKLTNDFMNLNEMASKQANTLVSYPPKSYAEKDKEQINKYKEYANENRVEESKYQATLAQMQNTTQHAVAMQLNEFAYDFYRLTNDKKELKKALTWIRYALNLEKSPRYYITYSKILNRLNKKIKAKYFNYKAIKLSKEQKKAAA